MLHKTKKDPIFGDYSLDTAGVILEKLIMGSLLKFAVKSGLTGAAVYYTIEQGVWKDSTHTTKLYKEILENVKPLLQQPPLNLELPVLPKRQDVGFVLRSYWNCGVLTTGRFLSELPGKSVCWAGQGYDYVAKQLSEVTAK